MKSIIHWNKITMKNKKYYLVMVAIIITLTIIAPHRYVTIINPHIILPLYPHNISPIIEYSCYSFNSKLDIWGESTFSFKVESENAILS